MTIPHHDALPGADGDSRPLWVDSYDEHQISQPLLTCATCGRQVYPTSPQTQCRHCLESSTGSTPP